MATLSSPIRSNDGVHHVYNEGSYITSVPVTINVGHTDILFYFALAISLICANDRQTLV